MADGRNRITRILATLCITAVGGLMLAASPSAANPSVKDVQARVDHLYHQAEVASERLNEARDRLSQAKTRMTTLRADLEHKQQQVDDIRRQVVSSVIAQSQGQAFSTATQVALSDSPDAFLDRLVVVSQYNDQQTQMKSQFATEARQLELRQQAEKRELAQISKTKQELATQKATIDKKAAQAKDLLQRVKTQAAAAAAQRAAAASRALTQSRPPVTSTPTVPTSSASGRAGAAVSYALAQVGDAYVWGASGPDAFDCSGLTMMAWQQAGVSLPHSAASQMSYGTSVSSSQLQPGDLVFYYSPVHHVGIYIGNGKIVHAANPTDGVLVAPVFSMPFSGAVRPG